ncbi:MAG: YncE family protein [Paludibacter sp.]|nr:YncE family protein [Paludibacter sp.]
MNKKNLFLSLLIAIGFGFTFSSCDPNETVEDVKVTTGLLVLDQGKFLGNNAGLTYYDLATQLPTTDVFLNKNNRGIGDTGQDMIQYGSKIYVAVYSSSLIEVIDSKSLVSIKTIPMRNEKDAASSPRALASAKGKVYVTLFDGNVAQLDTATLTVEKRIKVGPNPEGCAIVNNKLYVANSGGMQTVKDSTISVIDLTTFTELKKIKVNLNPGPVVADKYGDIYVISKGNYDDIAGKFQRVQTSNDKVTDIAMPAQYIDIVGDKAYVLSFEYAPDYSVINKVVGTYDIKNETIVSSNILKTEITKTPYCISVDPTTNYIYVGETDYKNKGKVNCFDASGNLKYSFSTGVNPAKVLFLK